MLNPAGAQSKTSATMPSPGSEISANTIRTQLSAESSISRRFTGLVKPEAQNELERLLSAPSLHWRYYGLTAADFTEKEQMLRYFPDAPAINHWLVKNGELCSEHTEKILGLLNWRSFCALSGVPNLISRCKMNIQFPSPGCQFSRPHVDQPRDHLAVIYYLMDSDGDTVIFRQRRGETITELTVEEVHAPKKGDFVVFDGNHYHSAGIPSHGSRAVINFNLLLK